MASEQELRLRTKAEGFDAAAKDVDKVTDAQKRLKENVGAQATATVAAAVINMQNSKFIGPDGASMRRRVTNGQTAADAAAARIR